MEAKILLVEVYKIVGIGAVPIVKVIEGTLKPGMKIGVDGKIMEIKSIEMNHKQLSEAPEGFNVAISFHRGDQKLLEKLRGKEVVFSDQVSPEVKNI